MHKKLLLLLALFAVPALSLAAPVSWNGDFTNQVLQPLTSLGSARVIVGTSTIPSFLVNGDLLGAATTTNDFADVFVANTSTGNCATAEFAALNNSSTLTNFFSVFGHTGSGFTGVGCANTPYTDFGSNATYIVNPNGDINFALGTTSSSAAFKWYGAGYNNASRLMTLTQTGKLGIGTSSPFAGLQIARSDVPQLMLSNPSAGADLKHWYASTTIAGDLQIGMLNDALTTYSPDVTILANGNVGVGTTSPSAALQIRNSTVPQLNIDTGGTDVRWTFTQNGTAGAVLNYNPSAGASFGTQSGTPSAGRPVFLQTAGQNRLAITGTGLVGIGTTTPQNAFVVSCASSCQPTFDVTDPTSFVQFRFSEDGTAASRVQYIGSQFATANRQGNLELVSGATGGGQSVAILPAGTERARFTSTGLGIGTTSPSALLELGNSTNGGIQQFITNSNTGTSAFAEIQIRNGYGSDALRLQTLGTGFTTSGAFTQDAGLIYATPNLSGGLAIGAGAGAGTLRFYTGGSAAGNERMRIDGSGNVGIGTTSPVSTLAVVGTTTITAGINARGILPQVAGNVVVCINATTGDFYYGATNANCNTSSEQDKTDFSEDVGGLNTILALRPYAYEYKEGEEQRQVGFKAEDVELIDARLVYHDQEGKVTGLRYENFLAPVVNAIKYINTWLTNLDTRTNNLEVRMNTLESRVNALESENACLKAGTCH